MCVCVWHLFSICWFPITLFKFTISLDSIRGGHFIDSTERNVSLIRLSSHFLLMLLINPPVSTFLPTL